MLPGRAKLVKQPSEALEMEGKKVRAIFDNQEAPIFVRNFVLLLFVAHHCLCCCHGLSSPLLQLCNYLCAVSRIIEEFGLAGTWIFSTRLGCSELPPAWPWMCPGTEYLSPLWATCYSVSSLITKDESLSSSSFLLWVYRLLVLNYYPLSTSTGPTKKSCPHLYCKTYVCTERLQ